MLADEQRTIMELEERAIDLTAELGRLLAASEPVSAAREQGLWQLRVALDRALVELKEAQARRAAAGAAGYDAGLGLAQPAPGRYHP